MRNSIRDRLCSELVHERDQWVRDFWKSGQKLLRDNGAATAWCYRHKAYCPTWPPAETTSGEGNFMVEVWTPSCVSWSQQSNSPRHWMCPTNKPLLAWTHGVLELGPHAVVLECVPGLDLPTIQCFQSSEYVWCNAILSPFMLSFPVSGDRLYAVARHLHKMPPFSNILSKYSRNCVLGP